MIKYLYSFAPFVPFRTAGLGGFAMRNKLSSIAFGILVLTALPAGTFAFAGDHPRTQEEVQKEVDAIKARENTPTSAASLELRNKAQDRLYIRNCSEGDWTLTCVNDLATPQLKEGLKGTMDALRLTSTGLSSPSPWKAGNKSFVLRANQVDYLILAPALDQDFAQLFKLTDQNNRSMYFTVTHKGASPVQPQFGIAAFSYALNNEQKILQFYRLKKDNKGGGSDENKDSFVVIGICKDAILETKR
jgi:hypothetical protein